MILRLLCTFYLSRTKNRASPATTTSRVEQPKAWNQTFQAAFILRSFIRVLIGIAVVATNKGGRLDFAFRRHLRANSALVAQENLKPRDRLLWVICTHSRPACRISRRPDGRRPRFPAPNHFGQELPVGNGRTRSRMSENLSFHLPITRCPALMNS